MVLRVDFHFCACRRGHPTNAGAVKTFTEEQRNVIRTGFDESLFVLRGGGLHVELQGRCMGYGGDAVGRGMHGPDRGAMLSTGLQPVTLVRCEWKTVLTESA